MSSSVWPKAVPLLVFAGLIAYANCIPRTFLFDDDIWLVDQPKLDDPVEYFQAMPGRPLLAATNLALHQVGRHNPVGHHVLNILVHIAAGLTLYGVIRRSLLRPRFAGRFEGRAPYLAFAATLLWMVHPIQVQSVTYVIQRGESMAGLFYLLILYAMLRADEVSPAPRFARLRRFGWYALAVVSVMLGYMSKEILASAPGAVLLFDRIFLTSSLREMFRKRWLYYLCFLAAWGGFTAWNLSRAAETEGGIGFKIETVPPLKYALTQPGVILYYLQIIAWPRKLSIDYQGWPWAETVSDAMPALVIVGLLLLLTLVLLVWRPALGFVWAWFFIALAPTSSVLPIVDALFEHRLYLSIASAAILVVFLGDWLLRTLRVGWMRPVALGVLVVVLGVLTHLRTEQYRTRTGVWEAAVERMPDSVRPRANLAQGLILDGRNAEVIPILERALEIKPADPTSLQNMAIALEQLGRYRDAAHFYRRLLDVYPADARFYLMYGDSLLLLGHWPEAEVVYKRATEVDPKSAPARYGRAAALFAMGRPVSADVEARNATDLDPDWPETVLERARVVILDEGRRYYPDACRSALTWSGLGIQYMTDPHPKHRDTLGLCFAAARDFDRAAAQSRLALESHPVGPWGSLHLDRIRDYEQQRVPWPE